MKTLYYRLSPNVIGTGRGVSSRTGQVYSEYMWSPAKVSYGPLVYGNDMRLAYLADIIWQQDSVTGDISYLKNRSGGANGDTNLPITAPEEIEEFIYAKLNATEVK